MIKGILMTLRLLWLVALITGTLFYFHVALPIQLHMYLGFGIGLLMVVLVALGLRRAMGLSVVTLLMAILLPVIGILQLTHIGMPDLPYIQVTHVVVGIAAIGLAEVLGKRLSS